MIFDKSTSIKCCALSDRSSSCLLEWFKVNTRVVHYYTSVVPSSITWELLPQNAKKNQVLDFLESHE
ncbi:unnamed protein product [Larinioides sclopetarius]|uniref:Uncharacterized protein n=1 Tax=Larinioides sclopetarius TaxID=280406 RepID=A0AAV2BP24_9ARAC